MSVCPQGGPRLRILSSGRYLQINNAELGDSATYTCVARNVAGETTREFVLAVHGNIPEQPRAARPMHGASAAVQAAGTEHSALLSSHFWPLGHAQTVGSCAWPHGPLRSPQTEGPAGHLPWLTLHLSVLPASKGWTYPSSCHSQGTSRVSTHIQD